jgi:two-component system sensor histidine kinase PilS (NtrC family)
VTVDTTENFDELHSLQRSTILRVYNYYRILISFLFLYLFSDDNFREFVGSTNPELFHDTIVIYLSANILISLALPLFISDEFISKTAPSFFILTADIVALTLLMSASGGVVSGLGNFLIFTVAFGGSLIYGRLSTVLPAIAFILTIYTEFYLFFFDADELQNFFQAGILGIVYFVANIFFQTLSQQIRRRETEVFTLEQINQLVVDKISTGVVVASHEGIIKLINAAGRDLLFPGTQELRENTELPRSLRSKIRHGQDYTEKQTFTFHVDDDSPDLLATYSKVSSSDPQLDTLVFIEDSTLVQQQAQQLKLVALGRLSASIAHEIRNPLGAISHAAQLLGESEKLDRGDLRLSEIIQTHCVRLNNVVENVLQMSRRKTAEPKNLQLNDWLDEFISDFKAGLSEESDITVELQDQMSTQLRFDPLHLSQILGNLCQNGLRYSKKKTNEAKMTIRVGVESDVQFIDVIDFGEGVAEDLIPNLFEPFYTTEVTGTGLGLYLSRELCEANSARLSYSNRNGSRFRISFVLRPTQQFIQDTAER